MLRLSQTCTLECGNKVRLLAIYHIDIYSHFHPTTPPAERHEPTQGGPLTLHLFPFTNVMCTLLSIRKDPFTVGKLSAVLIVCQVQWWLYWYVCRGALVSSPHVAVVYPVSALALRLVVPLISAFLFLHEALYETSNQLLIAVNLPSFPMALCRVAGDSRIQHANDVVCS